MEKRIHFTGAGYYYKIGNQQISKHYKTKWRLQKYAKIQVGPCGYYY